MPENVSSTVRLFEDDTIAYLTESSENNILKEDLNKLSTWEEKWIVQFHPDKHGECVVLPITKIKDPIHNNYILHIATT